MKPAAEPEQAAICLDGLEDTKATQTQNNLFHFFSMRKKNTLIETITNKNMEIKAS